MRIDQRHPVEPGARRTTFRKPRATQLAQLCSEAVDGKARLLRCLATRLARWRSELTHHWESLPSDHFGNESGAAVFWVETISGAVLTAAGEKHGNVAFNSVAAGDCRMAGRGASWFQNFLNILTNCAGVGKLV